MGLHGLSGTGNTMAVSLLLHVLLFARGRLCDRAERGNKWAMNYLYGCDMVWFGGGLGYVTERSEGTNTKCAKVAV